ncbi:MAG TPA: SRPBCC family protein [Candidatus Limnocylindria bacterium]
MAVHTIEIERSIEDVFAVLTDVTKTGRWYPARVEEWWVTPPPHGVGSVRRARVMVLGRASENDAVVTEYDPPRRAAMKGESASAPFTATLDFTPVPGGTRAEVETIFELRGLMRVVGPLFIGPYERGWDKGLQNLKRMMEAGALDPGTPASESPSA